MNHRAKGERRRKGDRRRGGEAVPGRREKESVHRLADWGGMGRRWREKGKDTWKERPL